MDKQAMERLEMILKMDPSAITAEQKAFLKARWAYVGRNSRRKFASLFGKKK